MSRSKCSPDGAARDERDLAGCEHHLYAIVAVLFPLWLAFTPAIDNLGQVLVIAGLAVLAVVGVEALRAQAAQEFPPGPSTS